MPSSPITSPRLHKDVALQVADVAHVPLKERDQFCELVQGTVQIVWELDRRARSSKLDQTLDEAAQAARSLHKAFSKLKQHDRDWLEYLLARNSYYSGELRELPLTVWRLAHLFSTAVGKSLPPAPVQAVSPKKRDWRQRTVKNVAFENFLTHLFVDVAETGDNSRSRKTAGRGH
jgi:hypothetical protein